MNDGEHQGETSNMALYFFLLGHPTMNVDHFPSRKPMDFPKRFSGAAQLSAIVARLRMDSPFLFTRKK
jgi:hypothetical protein